MIFDFSKDSSIIPMNDIMGMDTDGDLHMRAGDNCSMDMNSGEIHFTSSWETQNDFSSSSMHHNKHDFDNDF